MMEGQAVNAVRVALRGEDEAASWARRRGGGTEEGVAGQAEVAAQGGLGVGWEGGGHSDRESVG